MSYTTGNSIPLHPLTSEVQPPSFVDNNNIYNIKQTIPNKHSTDLNTEPVIFEPIRNIRLSRATYKVTNYINFDPYLANFEKFDKYLSAFKEDLTDRNKMGTIMDVDSRYKIRGYDWDCSQKLPSQFGSIRCRLHRQYLRIVKETDVIRDLFRGVHQRFLAAIDHLDYYLQEGEYLPRKQYEELDASESAFLDSILE